VEPLDVLALAVFFSIATPIAIAVVGVLRVIRRTLWRIES
jgi:hypothetical protein